MSTVAKPYTFSPNTSAASSEVNANFDTIYNDYNGSIAAANLASGAVTTAKIASDAVTNDKIADAVIFPEQLVAGTGTGWAWQSWTPTLANLSGGTQTYAQYTQVGKTVHFRFKYTLAGAGVGTGPTFTLPVTAHSDYNSSSVIIGIVHFVDNGTATYFGSCYIETSTTIASMRVLTATGSYTNIAAISATVPFTWAATDFIIVSGTYEAA